MLKRLFGIGKKQAPSTPDAPSATLARRAAPLYDNPVAPYENYFNVHFYGASLDRVVALVREYYLQHVVRGTVGAVVVQSGGWVTAYFPEAVVKGLGFNRLASQMAETLDTWVIAYRVFARQGIDAHYFDGPHHIDQLAYAHGEVEFEPEDVTLFARLGDASAVVPRRPEQHPLDFHFALLTALGIDRAAMTWEQAHDLGGQPVEA